MAGPKRKQDEPEKRPPMPSTGCSKCSYKWVNGGWTPTWNQDCEVHPSPSDLL